MGAGVDAHARPGIPIAARLGAARLFRARAVALARDDRVTAVSEGSCLGDASEVNRNDLAWFAHRRVGVFERLDVILVV